MKTRILMIIASVLSLNMNAEARDFPAIHGMLVFGQGRTYLSHLPMFHSPHDYQVILEARLPREVQELFVEDQKRHPEETVYTLVPEALVLPALVAHPRSFHADLYRGHFERGGVLISTNLTVEIAGVIHFHQFDPKAVHPAHPEYVSFGDAATGLFRAHLITAKPDFDEVAREIRSGEYRSIYFEEADLSD